MKKILRIFRRKKKTKKSKSTAVPNDHDDQVSVRSKEKMVTMDEQSKDVPAKMSNASGPGNNSTAPAAGRSSSPTSMMLSKLELSSSSKALQQKHWQSARKFHLSGPSEAILADDLEDVDNEDEEPVQTIEEFLANFRLHGSECVSSAYL